MIVAGSGLKVVVATRAVDFRKGHDGLVAEDKIRGEAPATRQFVRWTESAPLVNAFGVWLDEQRSRVSPRSCLGEKLTYIANQWDGLLVFLYDGRVEGELDRPRTDRAVPENTVGFR